MQLRRATSVDSLVHSGSNSSYSTDSQSGRTSPLGSKFGVKTYCGRFMIDQTTQTPENWRTNWSIGRGSYWMPSTTNPSKPGQDLSTLKETKTTTVTVPAEATRSASGLITAAGCESDSEKQSLDRAVDRRALTRPSGMIVNERRDREHDGQEEANDNGNGHWPRGARDQTRPGRAFLSVDYSNSVTSTANLSRLNLALQKLTTNVVANQANLNRCDDDDDDCGDYEQWNTSLATSHCSDQWILSTRSGTDWRQWFTNHDNQENDPNRFNTARTSSEQHSTSRWLQQEVTCTKRSCGEQCRQGPWRSLGDQSGVTRRHRDKSLGAITQRTADFGPQLAWTHQDNGGTLSSDLILMPEEQHSEVTKSLPISIPRPATRTNHQLFGFFGAYASPNMASAGCLSTGASQSRLSFNSLEEFNQEIAELMERNQIECKESNESENNGRRAPVTELIDEAVGESGSRAEAELGPRWAALARSQWQTVEAAGRDTSAKQWRNQLADQSCLPFAYCDDDGDLDHSLPWNTHEHQIREEEKMSSTKRMLDESFVDRWLLDEECEEHGGSSHLVSTATSTTTIYQTHITSSTKCAKLHNARAWVQVLPSPKMIAAEVDVVGSETHQEAVKSKPVGESERDLTIANNLIIEFLQQQQHEYQHRQQCGPCNQDTTNGEFVLKPSYQSAFLPVLSHGTGTTRATNATASNRHHYLQTSS